MSDLPKSDEQNADKRQFLLFALAGDDSKFRGVKPSAALLTLASIRDKQNSIAKIEGEHVLPEDKWDFRSRNTVSEQTGFNISTISSHWRTLEQGGWIEQGARGNYRTTPQRLTKKAWAAWNAAEKIHVPKKLIEDKHSFGTLLILSYLSYRAGLTATSEKYHFGFCNEGTRAMSEATGLERRTVRTILEALIADGLLVRELQITDKGQTVPNIAIAPQLSGVISRHCPVGQSGESGGVISRRGWGNIASLSILQSDIQTNNPAGGGSAAPPCGQGQSGLTLPPELEAVCCAFAKRAHYISFDNTQPEWFLRICFTAALAELTDVSLLTRHKFKFVRAVGIDPFCTSLQSNLVTAYGNVCKRDDVKHPEPFFKKVELEQKHSAQALAFLYKSEFRKTIDKHFQAIRERIAELCELENKPFAFRAFERNTTSIAPSAAVAAVSAPKHVPTFEEYCDVVSVEDFYFCGPDTDDP